MPILQWSNGLSVDNVELDNQHKELFKIINDLSEIYNNKLKEGVSEIIDRLINYELVHFVTEENFMEKIRYPFLENHKQEHIKLLEGTKRLKEEYVSNPSTTGLKLASHAAYYLTYHINESDYSYIEYARIHANSIL